MSLKHAIFGLCVATAALTATVTTVSAAGSEAGFAKRTSSATLVAAAGTAGTAALIAQQTVSFDNPVARTGTAEEALSASSLGLLGLAALLAVGLLMTRRNGRV